MTTRKDSAASLLRGSAPPRAATLLSLIFALCSAAGLLSWAEPAQAQSTVAYVSESGSAPTTGPVGSLTLTAPAGIAAGELLVAFVAQNASTLPPVSAVPSGWTQVLEQDDGTTIGGAVYYKFATSADVGG